ncbi:MAG: hypothetical protein GQ569_05790 [Methylococcaceae bacterium]|nr:hypothetical protein [Methylococcaceae bacterium]
MENRLIVRNCIDQLTDDMNVLSRLFYKELFHLDLQLKTVFSGNVVFLNRKFINMLATLKNVKHLENIKDSISKMGERHILQHHAEIKHFPLMKQALLKALEEHLGQAYNDELEQAWSEVFDEVSEIMEQAMAAIEGSEIVEIQHEASKDDLELLNDIGGEEIILKVHQRFYEIIFNEPWLEAFFLGKSKEALIKKQTEFMIAAFNGVNNYTGDTPAFVHMHMFITDEMIETREKILKASIIAEGLSESIADRWLKVDHSFKAAIVKGSIDECVLKCKGQVPITATKPLGYKLRLPT